MRDLFFVFHCQEVQFVSTGKSRKNLDPRFIVRTRKQQQHFELDHLFWVRLKNRWRSNACPKTVLTFVGH